MKPSTGVGNVPEGRHPPVEETVPTAAQLARRRKRFVERARQPRAEPPREADPFPSAEEMLREDRLR